jgi:hypothetical protein
LEYALGIVNRDLTDEDRRFAEDFGRRLVDAHFVAALPDVADRQLIGNAIGYGCDAFCTCDRATIIKKRDQLRSIPLAHPDARGVVGAYKAMGCTLGLELVERVH